ncbi:MAG: hypothetical protein ACKOJF_33480, partial [Planctomycetaceae bacterium]
MAPSGAPLPWLARRVAGWLMACVVAGLPSFAGAAGADQPPPDLGTFLKQHCLDCHGERMQKG